MTEVLLIVLMFGGGYIATIILLVAATRFAHHWRTILGVAAAPFILQNSCAYWGTRKPEALVGNPDALWWCIVISTVIFCLSVVLIVKRKRQGAANRTIEAIGDPGSPQSHG